jgi:hypothetical protein
MRSTAEDSCVVDVVDDGEVVIGLTKCAIQQYLYGSPQ